MAPQSGNSQTPQNPHEPMHVPPVSMKQTPANMNTQGGYYKPLPTGGSAGFHELGAQQAPSELDGGTRGGSELDGRGVQRGYR